VITQARLDVAGPGTVALLLGGSLLALCLLTMLIALIEATAMVALKWGAFRQAIIASLVMNLASTILGAVLLIIFPHPPFWGLLIAWALSTLVEGGILMAFQRGAPGKNWRAALIANLASYLLLILPSYYFGMQG
jgi:hypothetical protein